MQRACTPQARRTVRRATGERHGSKAERYGSDPEFDMEDGVPAVSCRRSSIGDIIRTESGRLRSSSQVQLTKQVLRNEIEARSLKLSARWRRRAINHVQAEEKEEVEQLPKEKLFVVSARLPFTVIVDEETGSFTCDRDPFALDIAKLLSRPRNGASSCNSDAASNSSPPHAVLVGAPVVRRRDGSTVVISDTLQEELDLYLRTQQQVLPVFIPPNREHFADWVIFPLFHYSFPSAETGGLGIYDWEGYELINAAFRDVVLAHFRRGDLVWINDYQLMLLPKLLRKERPDIIIGFYSHCVFPSSEVYRILPQRTQILQGVLSSNLIGFHNFQYARRFFTSCTRILGVECTSSGIEACDDAGGTYTKVIAVPLGINLDPYLQVLAHPDTKERSRELCEQFGGKMILVAMDRLEEKKGIPHKLMAFHKFLQNQPSWAKRCVFIHLVEPEDEASYDNDAEEEVQDIQKRRDRLLHQAYEMVGEINSRFGTIGHLPVNFMYRTFSRVEITALFSKAHVMLDTSLRDMLSRSAHEFLACQREEDCGVLILSEFSGSAQSLRAAALTVNPWDTNGFADAIQDALEMELLDRKELYRYGNRYVHDYTLKHWATNFFDELLTTKTECETERLQIPPPLDHEMLLSAMVASKRRLYVFSWSGTLLPHPPLVHRRLNPALLANLRTIGEDPNTFIIIISSFPRDAVAKAMGDVRCWIVAEAGACLREPGGEWCDNIVDAVDGGGYEWMGPVRDIMDYFAARTPGSNVVETDTSVSWLYQKTQGDHAEVQSKELLIHLWAGPLTKAPAETIVEAGCVSVRPTELNQTTHVEDLLRRICCENGAETPKTWLANDACIVVIGDFLKRDEEIYSMVSRFFTAEGCGPPKSPLSRSPGDPLHIWDSTNDKEDSLSLCSENLGRLEESAGKFGDKDLVPKKTPSEPDLLGAEPVSPVSLGMAPCAKPEFPRHLSAGDAVCFQCSIGRRASRADYHLSDCNDVAFLVAKIARALRHEREVEAAS